MASEEKSKKPPDRGAKEGMELRNRKDTKKSQDGANNSEGVTQQPANDTSPISGNNQQQPQQQPAATPPQQPPPDPPEVLYIPADRVIFAIPRWICWTVFGVFSIAFIAFGGYVGDRVYRRLYNVPIFNPNEGLESVIGEEGVSFFKQFDRDGDKHLSLDEFEAMYYRFLGEGLNVSFYFLKSGMYA